MGLKATFSLWCRLMEKSYMNFSREAFVSMISYHDRDNSLIRDYDAHAVLEDYERDLARLAAEYRYKLSGGDKV